LISQDFGTARWQLRIERYHNFVQPRKRRRPEFLAGLGGAVAWPLTARAQQGERVRRIGVLMPYDENDPVMKTRLSAFTQALADFGWTVGRKRRMDLHCRILPKSTGSPK
jgi:hypothetical protein